MSLCLVDEDRAVLEAALMFLDSCDDGGQDLHSLFDLSSDLSELTSTSRSSSASDQSSGEDRTSTVRTEKDSSSRDTCDDQQLSNANSIPSCQKVVKRSKTGVPAVRRRTKDEILELREQVLQLTAQLSELQLCKAAASRRYTIRANGPRLPRLQVQGSRVALGSAVLERAKLREAEALNLKLKVAWRQQAKLTRKLENVFKKQIATAVALVQASISERGTTRVFSSSHVHHDMLLGQTFEFTTNSPMQCEVRDLKEHIWGMLVMEEAHEKPNMMHHDAREHSSTAYEHQFTQNLDCQFGAIHVNGVSVIRKFTEPHRVVICYMSMLVLAGTELTFRESGWLLLQDQGPETNSEGVSKCSAKPRALLQTCYRMHSENSSPGSSSTCALGDTEYFRNFVVQSQCESMRTQQLHLQSVLLEKFSASPTPATAATDEANTQLPRTSGCFFAKLPLR